jgi:lactate dehydrogenase-like 2-hydroxyacid dehydrogenase
MTEAQGGAIGQMAFLSVSTLTIHSAPSELVSALGINPKGATLGILGMGSIGRIVCRQMKAFGMKVVYHNRNKLPEDCTCGVLCELRL